MKKILIIGLDGLNAVSEGEVNFVKMITRKPPNALINFHTTN